MINKYLIPRPLGKITKNCYIENMDTINRSIAIIKPKQPFINWANQLPDAEHDTSLEDLQDDCQTILIPNYETNDEAKKYIDGMAEDIFEEELFSWCTHEPWWPKKRTKKLFWEWFEAELHSIVIDSCNEPIVEE